MEHQKWLYNKAKATHINLKKITHINKTILMFILLLYMKTIKAENLPILQWGEINKITMETRLQWILIEYTLLQLINHF